MGLARDLTLGSSTRSKAVRPEFAALRRMTRASAPDVALLQSQIETAGALSRMRFQEGVIYAEACEKYRILTGDAVGPSPGVY